MGVPSQPERELSLRMLQDVGERLLCAVAIKGHSLASVTKRTVVATVFLLSRAPHTKVFSDAEEGVQWLVARLDGAVPPSLRSSRACAG